MSTHSAQATTGVQDAGIIPGSQTGLAIVGSLSMSCWFRPTTIGRIHTLHCRSGTAVGSTFGYMLRIHGSNELEFIYSTDGAITYSAVSTGLSLVNDRWIWLGAVFRSATPEVQFYKNNLPLGSAVSIGGTGVIGTPSVDYRVGNYHGGDAANNIVGYIDQCRIFDDERTDAEMVWDFTNDASAQSEIQGAWTLDDVLTDISGNGNTLVNNGLSFVEGEIPGLPGAVMDDGISSSPGVIDIYSAGVVVGESAGGLPALTHTMRAYDTDLTKYVYWRSQALDATGVEYSGNSGALLDIVVFNLIEGT